VTKKREGCGNDLRGRGKDDGKLRRLKDKVKDQVR